MSEDASEPSHEDNALSVERPRKRRWRITFALAIAAVTITAAWWCFGPSRSVRFPGTVSVMEVERGHWVVAAASSEASGDAMYVYNDDLTVGEFRSEHWSPISLTSTIDLLANNRRRVYVNERMLVARNGRAIFQGRFGELVLREPDGRIDRIYLRIKDDSKTVRVTVQDAHWLGEQLVVLVKEERPAPPHRFWRITYQLPRDEGHERRVLPSKTEQLADDVYWASFRSGIDDWVAFQLGFGGSLTAGQTLMVSDGFNARLPGIVDLSAASLIPCREGLVINGRDGVAALHIPHGKEGAEFVLLPLDGDTKFEQKPLKLPIETMNTWIHGQTLDGRYALVHGRGIRRSWLWLKNIHPSFDHYTTRDDLVLIDLQNWQVVAEFSHTSRSFQTSRWPIRNPAFSHDDKHILIPSEQTLIKVNIQDWIDACR